MSEITPMSTSAGPSAPPAEPGTPGNPYRYKIPLTMVTVAMMDALTSNGAEDRRAAMGGLYTRVGIFDKARQPQCDHALGFCDDAGLQVETFGNATHLGWSPLGPA